MELEIEYTVEYHVTENGRRPFKEWADGLKDRKLRVRVDARLTQLQVGQFGDAKSVGDKVFELRIHYGPGYRIYFGRIGLRVILLLTGGSKGTQNKDIQKAKRFLKDAFARKDSS